MEIVGERVMLRDFCQEDIEDHIRWNTVFTEWKEWDTPWQQNVVFDAEEYRRKQQQRCRETLSQGRMRYSLEIELLGESHSHIGFCNVYTIGKNYEPTEKEIDYCIGIDIPEKKYRKNGYGKDAFQLYINYLNEQGIRDVYTQTWSGNKAMIALAQSLSFSLCQRKNDVYQKDGVSYDYMTFVR